MVFFRKKKVEEDIEDIKSAVGGRTVPEEAPPILPSDVETEKKEPRPVEEVEKPEPVEKETPIEKSPKESKKPVFAPLFVKIDKYRSVLNTINDLKTTIIMLKNSMIIQKHIENLREENRKILYMAVGKLDKKLVALDSEFLRPAGFEEEFPSTIYETGGIEGVVDDLKKQIEGLKSELKTIS